MRINIYLQRASYRVFNLLFSEEFALRKSSVCLIISSEKSRYLKKKAGIVGIFARCKYNIVVCITIVL